LAAQVLHMASLLEGEGSEVIALVSSDAKGRKGDNPLSLAERVVALRNASVPKKGKAVPAAKL
ncbi:MAG: hypothetical protein AAFR27_04860, partial [Pseudomonadota bacterium]